MKLIENEPILNLCTQMMRIQNRIGLQAIRKELQSAVQYINIETVEEISEIIQKSTSECTNQYIDILKNFS